MTRPILSATLFLLLTGASCQKDELLEPTQEGKNTFGCLVNGNLFGPKERLFGGDKLTIQYGKETEKGRFICISANMKGNEQECNSLSSMSLCILESAMEEGKTYTLSTEGLSDADGQYSYFPSVCGSDGQIQHYYTTDETTGQLTITRLDKDKRIFSGTFWFDAVSKNGERVEVREGTFDLGPPVF